MPSSWCKFPLKYVLLIYLFECQRGLKDRITLLAVRDRHVISPPPKTHYPLLVAFSSLFHQQMEGEPCEDISTRCREHNCNAKCQVTVSFPCFAFLFQKSLQTLSQFHQKVSSDSYFLFKRKERICIAMNFWLERFVQSRQIGTHC